MFIVCATDASQDSKDFSSGGIAYQVDGVEIYPDGSVWSKTYAAQHEFLVYEDDVSVQVMELTAIARAMAVVRHLSLVGDFCIYITDSVPATRDIYSFILHGVLPEDDTYKNKCRADQLREIRRLNLQSTIPEHIINIRSHLPAGKWLTAYSIFNEENNAHYPIELFHKIRQMNNDVDSLAKFARLNGAKRIASNTEIIPRQAAY